MENYNKNNFNYKNKFKVNNYPHMINFYNNYPKTNNTDKNTTNSMI
jgi:hypothetical protein